MDKCSTNILKKLVKFDVTMLQHESYNTILLPTCSVQCIMFQKSIFGDKNTEQANN